MQEGMPCAQLGIRYLQKCMNKINMFFRKVRNEQKRSFNCRT